MAAVGGVAISLVTIATVVVVASVSFVALNVAPAIVVLPARMPPPPPPAPSPLVPPFDGIPMPDEGATQDLRCPDSGSVLCVGTAGAEDACWCSVWGGFGNPPPCNTSWPPISNNYYTSASSSANAGLCSNVTKRACIKPSAWCFDLSEAACATMPKYNVSGHAFRWNNTVTCSQYPGMGAFFDVYQHSCIYALEASPEGARLRADVLHIVPLGHVACNITALELNPPHL